jgi:hypothetical protein
MAAQATAKQKEAEQLIQAKIDAEVEKRTSGLVVKPPLPLVKPKPKTVEIADVAPEEISDDGVSRASGASKGAKRRRKHAALNELMKWRVFPTVVRYSRTHLRKWLKPRLRKS